MEQEVERRVGRYEIVRGIGRGGMAIVYLARQTDLERDVALKELSALQTADPVSLERFLREARMAGSLSHPNIVTVYEYFEHAETAYISMEYVERGSLRPLVGKLTLAQIAGVFEGLLAGLAHGETKGIVHRDLKPENVMVTAAGGVKIADFGIAKAVTNATGRFLTATGTAIGTPTYMAPEQAMARQVGPWTDLYSVGVMAYELLVGRVPFHDTETPMAILLRQVNDPVPPPLSVNPDLDAGLAAWIERLLAKEPSDRYQRALEAWEDLEEIVIAILGPRWRREAGLLGTPAAAETPTPLTPASFDEGAEAAPGEGRGEEGETGFETFVPRHARGKSESPPAEPAAAAREPAAARPETPAAEPPAAEPPPREGARPGAEPEPAEAPAEEFRTYRPRRSPPAAEPVRPREPTPPPEPPPPAPPPREPEPALVEPPVVASRADDLGVPTVPPVSRPPEEPSEGQREEERRRRTRKQVGGAAIVVAALAAAALLIGSLRNGGQPTNGGQRPERETPPPQGGALVWQVAGSADLVGQGDQVLTSIVNTSRGGLAYIAGGYEVSSENADAGIWTSKDGRTWQRMPAADFEGAGNQKINTVSDLGGALVAAGEDDSNGDVDAALWRSSDGTNWDRIPGLRAPGTDEVINRFAETSSGVVGAGRQTVDGGEDGAIWIFKLRGGRLEPGRAPVSDADLGGPGDQRINRVVELRQRAGTLVALGFADGDAGVWVSEDGKAWDRVRAAALGGDGDQEILDTTRFGSNLVAVGVERVNGGTSGVVWLSENGRSWRRVPDQDSLTSLPVTLNRVVPSGRKVVSRGVPALIAGGTAGGDAAVWTSNDGRTWKREGDRPGELGGQGQQVIHSLRANRLPVLAVGSSGRKNGLDAAVWLGSPVR